MPPRILYVEDDDANYLLVERVLGADGRVQVERASSAEEALERLERTSYDGILVDLDLPGRSGLDLGRTLGADPRWSGLPRVAISASVMKREREHAKEAGFVAFVAKPFEIAALRRLVHAILGLGRVDASASDP